MLPPRDPADTRRPTPERGIDEPAVGAHPVGERPPGRLGAHEAAGDRELAQQDEPHLPLLDEPGQALRPQDGIETVEAADRHDRLTGGDDDGRGELRARRRQQEALAVMVRPQEGRSGPSPRRARAARLGGGRSGREAADVGRRDHRDPAHQHAAERPRRRHHQQRGQPDAQRRAAVAPPRAREPRARAPRARATPSSAVTSAQIGMPARSPAPPASAGSAAECTYTCHSAVTSKAPGSASRPRRHSGGAPRRGSPPPRPARRAAAPWWPCSRSGRCRRRSCRRPP